ncbi:MAG: UvrD-helicase domain-containing protein [Verrucomicrobiota bacterium]|nr:UvrD-helicase domain-containing protein [Verrucomicrobiota bacterium]
MAFTAKQLEAIDISQLGRDACVVAGPGSGKTSVLVERYRRLIESGIPPHRILAITFTEKAAANMKSLLASKLGPQMEKAYVSTIHAFCYRLIRENAVLAGVDPAVAIFDEREAALLQRRTLTDALDELFAGQREAATLLMRSLSDPDLVANLLPVFEAMRGTGRGCDHAPDCIDRPTLHTFTQTLQQTVAECGTGLTKLQRQHLTEIVAWSNHLQSLRGKPPSLEIYHALGSFEFNLQRVNPNSRDAIRKLREETLPLLRGAILSALFEPQRETLVEVLRQFECLYQKRKADLAVLDYSDLESIAICLLTEHDEVRDRIRNQFQQVMIDEFQDTNPQQSRLLDLLRAPGTFYAVGDINQSIFSFRHSSPRIFRAYRDEVAGEGKHHVELTENWRSRPEILLAVETILDAAAGIEPRPLQAARVLPAKANPSIEAIIVKGAGDRMLEVEAVWVARKILELRNTLEIGEPGNQRRAEFRDMAVLVRNSEVFQTFSEAFEKHGIDHLLNRRKGFFESREVLDLAHLLRAISNPRDEISTAAVLRSPLVAVSDEAIFQLEGIDQNLGGALARLEHQDVSSFDPGDLAKLRHFNGRLKRWRVEQPYVSLDRVLLRAMDECGYTWEPGSRAGANIEKFLALARDARAPLAQFVEDLAMMRDSDARERDAPLDDSVNAVRMMTVHSAKGLEFPIVFLPTLHKGIDAGSPPFTFTQDLGLGISWKDPVSGEPQGDLIHVANQNETRRKEDEEADRLLYVALTRAEEHLVLSYGIEKKNPKNWAQIAARVFDPHNCEPDGVVREIVVNAPGERTFSAKVICVSSPPERGAYSPAPDIGTTSEILSPPGLVDQHDGNISVTSLALYADCPRRYYLARYLGWESRNTTGSKPSSSGIPASELGSQVHKLLAGVQVETPDFEALRLADTFERSKLGRRARRARRVEREFAFLLAIDDVVLSGEIDLWFEEGGELILVDYKTDDVDAMEAPARAQSYALQLRYYALALERVTGRVPDRAYVHLLRPDVLVRIDVDAASLEAAGALIREVAGAQSTARFPLHEGAHCRRCPFYRNLCPAT